MAQITITRVHYDDEQQNISLNTNNNNHNDSLGDDRRQEPDVKSDIQNDESDTLGKKLSDPFFDRITESIQINLDKRNSSASILSSTTSNDENEIQISEFYTSIPYGIQPRAAYDHGQKNTDIMGVAYNGRMRQFILLDAKGITTWKRDAVDQRVSRAYLFPKYEYRLFTHIVYVRKFNCYFVLTKDFSLKVLNRDFEETCSVNADLRSTLFMLFNPLKDELITGGVGGTKFWTFHQVAENNFNDLKPMANYRLTLKYELPEVGGSWVKRVELDYNLEHLYCCSDTDLNVYNFHGKQLFKFRKAHKMTITGCRYSVSAKMLITSSIDCHGESGQADGPVFGNLNEKMQETQGTPVFPVQILYALVKVWSMTGGLVHTFRGHSRAVTNLMIHPDNSSIVITSSLDGSVRMWSLETLEPLYSLVVSTEGILWMGLTDDEKFYLCTPKHLTLWSLNYFFNYWGTARSKLTSMALIGCQKKTTRLVTIGDDNSIRLFARKTGKNLSTILPPPDLSPLEEISSMCYSREFNVAFLLIDRDSSKTNEIWVYTTRTDPSCRIAVWNVQDLQMPYLRRQQKAENETVTAASFYQFNKGGAVYRATENGSGNESITFCHCLCLLNSTALMLTDEGEACPIRHSYLLLGMEDGRIFFMDPVVKGQKYMEFKASKDSIVSMSHDPIHNCLVTLVKLKYLTQIQIWTLPSLFLQYEVYCALDIVDYTRLNAVFLTGHTSGCLNIHRLEPVIDNGYYKLRTAPDFEDAVDVYKRPEHLECIICLDSSPTRKLFSSCSKEGAIKIWDEERVLLTEITMDGSLSSVLFLNNKADLIVGFKNHIFYIDHSHVCPHVKLDEDLSEEDEYQESVIYEDPAVTYEGFGSDPNPIDIDSYLIPYEIEFSKDFLEGKPLLESSSEEELEISDLESEYSMAPTDIYFSPPETPGKLANIDLMLGSEVTKNDLQKQMMVTMQQLYDRALRVTPPVEQQTTESQLAQKVRLANYLRHREGLIPKRKRRKKKDENLLLSEGETDGENELSRWKFNFPKFGRSPGPSPTLSFLSATPTLESDLDSDASYEDVIGVDGKLRRVKKLKKVFEPIDAADAALLKRKPLSPIKKVTFRFSDRLPSVSARDVKVLKPKGRYRGEYAADGEVSGIGDVRLDVKTLLKKAGVEEAVKKADHSHVKAEIDEHVSSVVRKQKDFQKKRVTKRRRPTAKKPTLKVDQLKPEEKHKLKEAEQQVPQPSEELGPDEPSRLPEEAVDDDDDPVTQVTLGDVKQGSVIGLDYDGIPLPDLPEIKGQPDTGTVARKQVAGPKKNTIEYFGLQKPGLGKSPTTELESETTDTNVDDATGGKKNSVTSAGTLSNHDIDDLESRIMMADQYDDDDNQKVLVRGHDIQIKNQRLSLSKSAISSASEQFNDDSSDSQRNYFMASSPAPGKLPFPSAFHYTNSEESSEEENEDGNSIEIDIEFRDSRSQIYAASPDSGWAADSEFTGVSGKTDYHGNSGRDGIRMDVDVNRKVRKRPLSSFVERRLYRAKLKHPEQSSSDAQIRDICEKEDLHIAFNDAYHRYQNLNRGPVTPQNLHKNNDLSFDDNWHERYIERHMLLRMQKELRTHEAAIKRKQRETEERNKHKLNLGLYDYDEDYQDAAHYHPYPPEHHPQSATPYSPTPYATTPCSTQYSMSRAYKQYRETPHPPQTTPTNSRPHTALPLNRRGILSHHEHTPTKQRPKTAAVYRNYDPGSTEDQDSGQYSERDLIREGHRMLSRGPQLQDSRSEKCPINKSGDSNILRSQSTISKKSSKFFDKSQTPSGLDLHLDKNRLVHQDAGKSSTRLDRANEKMLQSLSRYNPGTISDEEVNKVERITTPYRLQVVKDVPVLQNKRPKTGHDTKQINPNHSQTLRPKSSKSIPSKCSQYILVSKPKEKPLYPLPTPLEEQLLAERFPLLGHRIYDHYEGLIIRHRKPQYNMEYSPFSRELYGLY